MSADSPKPRIVVLISGSGSNLQAIIDARNAGLLPVEIAAVISNRPGAYGLQRAQSSGIDALCLPHGDFADRQQFDDALARRLDTYRPDLVLLAGFMRLLTAGFVAKYEGRLLNIHPSLLPLYPGLDTHRRAIDAGDTIHGCTVHYVTEELDGGPRIIQGKVPVLPDDDPGTLAQRVLAVEHEIYPQAVKLITDGRISYSDGSAWLDGKPLLEPLQH